jgi:hypothetical protein
MKIGNSTLRIGFSGLILVTCLIFQGLQAKSGPVKKERKPSAGPVIKGKVQLPIPGIGPFGNRILMNKNRNK